FGDGLLQRTFGLCPARWTLDRLLFQRVALFEVVVRERRGDFFRLGARRGVLRPVFFLVIRERKLPKDLMVAWIEQRGLLVLRNGVLEVRAFRLVALDREVHRLDV